MGSVTETVKTVNSTVRTVAFAGLVAIVGAGGYIGYSQYTANERAFKDKEAELEAAQGQLVGLKKDLDVKVAENGALKIDVAEKAKLIEKLETSMHLLKTDQRLARVKVISVDKDENGAVKSSKLEFVELSQQVRQYPRPRKSNYPAMSSTSTIG